MSNSISAGILTKFLIKNEIPLWKIYDNQEDYIKLSS